MTINSTDADGTGSIPPVLGTPDPVKTDYPFLFTGTGGEYFRIWIVNIALTLVTLGFYSPWAKVRNNRYIYGNTSVAEGFFDYHADPWVILRGRIIALVLLLIYLLGQNFFPVLIPILFVLLIIATPWIVVRSLAFNARNTSWRNIRFNFIGKPMGAAGAYLGWPLFGLVTLGFGMPFAWFKAAAFGANNHRLGQTHFNMTARPVDFYAIAMWLILASFVAALAAGLVGAAGILGAAGGLEGLENADSEDPISGAALAAQIPLFIIMALIYLTIFNLFGALRFKTIYDKLDLGKNRIHNSMSISGFLVIAVTNSLGMLFTLGLFYPWAKVRMTRFMVESLNLEAADLDNFVAAAESEQSAIGEELGEAFDLGIGV